jgi:hypothetical protein
MTRILIALVLAACAGCAAQDNDTTGTGVTTEVWEERSPAGQPLSGSEGVISSISAKVKSVDQAKRLVTVVGPTGREITVKAGDKVQRLSEVKAGDVVTLEYLEAMAFEVRPPTGAEKAAPAVAAIGEGRADKSAAPAGGVAGVVHQVAAISAIDHKAGTVTIKPAKGESVTIKAKYPENLKRVKVGDTVAITYTEAVALSLTPAKR